MSVPDEAAPNKHWLWYGDSGWECTGCDWSGQLDGFYATHEEGRTDDVPF